MPQTQETPATLTVTASKRLLHSLPTAALGMDLSADGKTLYLGCMDGVYQLQAESGEHKRLYEHASYVSGVVLRGDGTLISAGYDGALKWFDPKQGAVTRTVTAHDFWSWQMALSPDGKHVASVTGQYLSGSYKYEPAPEREPSVKIFDAQSGELKQSLPHVPSVQSVAFSPDSSLVAAGNLMGEIRVWEVASGKQVAAWTTPSFTSWGIIKSHCYLGGIFALAFTPDENAILAAGMGAMEDPMAGNGKQLWQKFAFKENPPRKIDETHSGENGEGLMETLAIHPGGKFFVMSGRLRGGDWNTALFDLESGKRLHFWKTDSRITKARFSPDGKQLFLAGTKGQPGFDASGSIPAFGQAGVFDLSITNPG